MNLATRLKPGHLRLLLEIAELGKLQSAANALAMTQPAASRILAEIEAHVGAPLFERHAKGMKPTPFGKSFVRHARVILGEFRNLEMEIEELSLGATGDVRIGAVTGPTVGVLVPAVQDVKQTAPGIRVTIEVAPSTQLVRGLEREQFDFIFARLPATSDSRNFRITPARKEIVSLLVRQDHPLVGKRDLRLADLRDYEWVIQEHGSPIRQAVEAAFHEANLPAPEHVTNSSSLLVALSYLANTHAVVPQSHEVAELLTGSIGQSSLTTLELREDISVSPYYIIRNAANDLHPAAKRVHDEVLKRL
jgi:DNA-binding transcriptional LysR family regulator